MDIASILAAITSSAERSNQQIAQVGESLADTTSQMEGLMQENLQSGQAISEAVIPLTTRKAEIDYATAKSRENMQATVDLQRESASNEFTRSVAQLTAAQREKELVVPKLRKATEVAFIDNPIGYIIGQLEAPALQARYDNLTQIENDAAKNIQQRTTMLSQMNSATVAATADASRELAYQSANVLKMEADQKVREQQINYMSKIGQQKMQAVSIADKQGDNLYKVFTTSLNAQQFQTTQDERAEMRKLRIEEMQTRMADKKQKDDAKHQLDGNIAAVSEMLGQVNPDGTPMISSVESLQNIVRDTKRRDAWGRAAMSGMLGDSFGTALPMFSENANRSYLSANRSNLLLASDEMRKGVGEEFARLSKFDPARGKQPDMREVAAEAPKAYENKIVSASQLRKEGGATLTSPEFDRVFNPYRAPHAIMLKSVEAGLKQDGLENNVMLNAVKTVAQVRNNGGNFKGADEQEAFKVVGELVKERKITPQQAAVQVARYYKLATSYADDAYGTSSIFMLPKQTTYAATIEIPAKGFGMNQLKVDLMNPASVERALTQYNVGRLDYLPKAGDVFGIGPRSGE